MQITEISDPALGAFYHLLNDGQAQISEGIPELIDSKAIEETGSGFRVKTHSNKNINPHIPSTRPAIDVKPFNPSLEEFLAYCKESMPTGFDYSRLRPAIELKYTAWKDAGWIDGNGEPIRVWKSKILNTIPHLKPIDQTFANATGQNMTVTNQSGQNMTIRTRKTTIKE